jgi:hypothetical protein
LKTDPPAALEQLAWSGACDALAGGNRRVARWQLGVTTPGVKVRGREGVQLALALDPPTPPVLQPLSAWDAMIADYKTIGLTTATHPIGLLRTRLHATGATDIGALVQLAHGARVRVGGASSRGNDRDREGHHVHVARGRARHRLAADLRTRSPHRAHRATRHR